MTADTYPDSEVFTVSALVGEAKQLLEGEFGNIGVEGEISNLARPRSGHVYFTLKDADAQLRCALFRREAQRVRFDLADGMQVLARGRVSIYPARGEFQFYVSSLEEAGLGALQRAFEALKKKLAEEGLFEQAAKRPLPRYPKRIGVITSPTGAALRDILNVLGRRYPAADVMIYPTQVQGTAAAGTIAAALARASERRECDVLILARGGGSLEDLWSFNEEAVARAIRASEIPVVSGVGHETDFTIADFVADFRAPTPSAAAESVTPDREELLVRLNQLGARIAHTWQRSERERRQAVTTLSQRLAIQHPQRRLQERAQRLDELTERLSAAPLRQLASLRSRLTTLNSELNRHSPVLRIERLRDRTSHLDAQLLRLWRQWHERRQAQVKTLAARLHALGPKQTLARGYAIVFAADGTVLRDASHTHPGSTIRARLAHGSLDAIVEKVDSKST
ncbi:MAG: exodeoxyribonuclease VII large subunit [Gammaproteobacteria bacterium]